jgi:hypothetical protein
MWQMAAPFTIIIIQVQGSLYRSCQGFCQKGRHGVARQYPTLHHPSLEDESVREALQSGLLSNS